MTDMFWLRVAARERRELGYITRETRGALNARGIASAEVERFILNTEKTDA